MKRKIIEKENIEDLKKFFKESNLIEFNEKLCGKVLTESQSYDLCNRGSITIGFERKKYNITYPMTTAILSHKIEEYV